MIHWRQIPIWLFRAWPLLALLPAFLLHWASLKIFPGDPLLVNKIIGMVLQIIGGLLILYSINDNLGLFRRKSLVTAVVEWFGSFPLVRQTISVGSSAIASFIVSGTGSVQANLGPSTIEERIARLEEGLKALRTEFSINAESARRQLQEAKAEISGRLDSNANQIDEHSKRLEHAAVGGFKVQAFGVLLALYGAVTNLYA